MRYHGAEYAPRAPVRDTEALCQPPRMVTCELSRVGCCLRRRQQQISTCRSQEGGRSLSRAKNNPRRLSQKVCGKIVLREYDQMRERGGNIIVNAATTHAHRKV